MDDPNDGISEKIRICGLMGIEIKNVRLSRNWAKSIRQRSLFVLNDMSTYAKSFVIDPVYERSIALMGLLLLLLSFCRRHHD